MKKILTILSVLFSVIASAQYPKQLNAYNPQTQVNFLGGVGIDGSLAFNHNYPDTVTVNLGFIKNIPNAIVVVNDTLMKRSSDATRWDKLGGGGSVGNTIYTGDGSLSGDRTIDLGEFFLKMNYESRPIWGWIPPDENAGSGNAFQYSWNVDGATVQAAGIESIATQTDATAIFQSSYDFDGTVKQANVVYLSNASGTSGIYTADTHTFNGNIIGASLATGGSAPATTGIRQGVIGDANGLLSFTNKTFGALTFGATTTWDYLTGFNKTLTLTGDADLVLTNVQSGDQGTFIVIQDGSGGHELTVPDAVLTINTDAGDTTVIGFINQNGTYYWATSVGGGGGGAVWGAITGTLSDQTDLQTALNAKVPTTTTVNGKALSGNITLGLASSDFANQGTTTTILHGNASGNPSFGQIVNGDITNSTIDLTTKVTGVLPGANGGTGVANTSKTITLGGNLTTSGAFNTTFTVTGSNTITFPNASITVASTNVTQTISAVNTFSSNPVISAITNTGTLTLPTVTGTAVQYIENTATNAASPTPTGDARINWYQLTAQSGSGAFQNPSGSVANHNELYIRILDNGGARVLSWTAGAGGYRASSDLPLPLTTVVSKTMYLHFVYNSASSTWDLLGLLNNFSLYKSFLIALILGGLFTYAEKKHKKSILIILMVVISTQSKSQTRLYCDRLVTSAYAPTVHANWNVTTGNTYVVLLHGKSWTASFVTITSGATGAAAVREMLTQTMITPLLAGQTIASGSTISAQFKTSISTTASQTGAGKVYIRLMNEDGTIASEIGNATTTNVTTASTNRTYNLTLGSNLVVTGGQRIVFEFGLRYLTGSTTTTTGSIQNGIAPATGDLPVDNTTTTSLLGWIEFSQTLVIASGYAAGIML